MEFTEEVLAEIHSAFPEAEPPQPLLIASNDLSEVAALSAGFAGRTWSSIPGTVFDENAENMSLVMPESLAYYLPGFMCRAIAHPVGGGEPSALNCTLYVLCNEDLRDDPWWVEQVSPLAPRQRRAVAAFLEWVAVLGDEACKGQSAVARRGLAYWSALPGRGGAG